MSTREIKLVQSPIIKHQLKEAGKEVSKRIDELNIENQIATIETVKSLKGLRAELNKELSDFEEQRSVIKKAVNNPYKEFEDLYKTEISDKYKSAVSLLKDKIAIVENQIKTDKKESVESYFSELCTAEQIDFISFDKLGIEIKLSVTEKKYKEQVYDFISKVNDDLALIKATDYEAETLTEYKQSLNVSNAITTVKTRKEKEATEKARLQAQKIQARKNQLEKLGLKFTEITNAYEFTDTIYIELDEVENLPNINFNAKIITLESQINDFQSKELEKKKAAEKAATEKVESTKKAEAVEKPIVKKPTPPPVAAPLVEKPTEPLKTASFEVLATMTQLRALGEYMKSNNITYKNI